MSEWSPFDKDTFNRIRLNSPPGGWFPALEDLYWCITESNPPYTDLFFSSPHLKTISIIVQRSWDISGAPHDVMQTLASTISALPTSSLQEIEVGDDNFTMPWAYFKDSLSSVVLRCGTSFTDYDSPVPLSDAAVNHLIHLPHLRAWRIHGPPPNYTAASLPLIFPPLEELTLGKDAARGWLPLFERLEHGVSTTQGATPLSKAKESLKVLNIKSFSIHTIDPSFVSPVQRFRNLVQLNIEVYCFDGDEKSQCAFKLNNDNVTELAMALTQLRSLLLGRTCPKNTCSTTVSCLLPISVHCTKLESLEVHFNTTNIVDDFKNILEDPRFQQLRSLPRCPLTCLDVFRIPLSLDGPGFETVAKGMINIFPSLKYCEGIMQIWDDLSGRIEELQGMKT